MDNLLSVEQAQAIITRRLFRLTSESLPLDGALGAVLAEPLQAERDQPPFDRVTMDGIAVAHQALAAGARRFPVQATQAAGAPPCSLGSPEHCIEVMTGAVLPAGCDTVIPVERIRVQGGQAELEAGYQAPPGQFVHPRGSDYRAGSLLLDAGTRIGVPVVAILAANGQSRVQVSAAPRIAIVSTGDEVVPVDGEVLPHQIRQSNSHAIAAALGAAGHRRCHALHLPDDPARLHQALGQALETSDVLILTGGVSRGKFDYVPDALSALGVEKHFHRVAQRPGKPMWFGTRGPDKLVFALPGNPVSTLVCLHRYVLPALAHCQGVAPRPRRWVSLAEPVKFKPAMTCFVPVRLESDALGILLAHPRHTNTSGDFGSLAGTEGFVELPADREEFPAGFTADFYPWGG